MVYCCSVVGCNNRSSIHTSASFHTFPFTDPERLKKWVKAVARRGKDGKPWYPTKNCHVCSDHFLPIDFLAHIDTKRVLQPTAVPSVFPELYYGPSRPSWKWPPRKPPKRRLPLHPKPPKKSEPLPWVSLEMEPSCKVPKVIAASPRVSLRIAQSQGICSQTNALSHRIPLQSVPSPRVPLKIASSPKVSLEIAQAQGIFSQNNAPSHIAPLEVVSTQRIPPQTNAPSHRVPIKIVPSPRVPIKILSSQWIPSQTNVPSPTVPIKIVLPKSISSQTNAPSHRVPIKIVPSQRIPLQTNSPSHRVPIKIVPSPKVPIKTLLSQRIPSQTNVPSPTVPIKIVSSQSIPSQTNAPSHRVPIKIVSSQRIPSPTNAPSHRVPIKIVPSLTVPIKIVSSQRTPSQTNVDHNEEVQMLDHGCVKKKEENEEQQSVLKIQKPFQDDEVEVLMEEYRRLYRMYQRLKELARINLNLLILCMNIPEGKRDLKKVQEMVDLLNGDEFRNVQLVESNQEMIEKDISVHDENLMENGEEELIEKDVPVYDENLNENAEEEMVDRDVSVHDENLGEDAEDEMIDRDVSVNDENPIENGEEQIIAEEPNGESNTRTVSDLELINPSNNPSANIEFINNKKFQITLPPFVKLSDNSTQAEKTVGDGGNDNIDDDYEVDLEGIEPTFPSPVIDRIIQDIAEDGSVQQSKKQKNTEIANTDPGSSSKTDSSSEETKGNVPKPKILIYHFVSKSSTDINKVTNNGQSSLECDECGIILRNSLELRRHRQAHRVKQLQDQRDVDLQTCVACGDILRNKRALRIHLLLHKENESEGDESDDSSLISEDTDVSDVTKTDKPVTDVTPNIPETETDTTTVEPEKDSRKKENRNENPTTCDQCGVLFSTERECEKHVKKCHQDVLCPICGLLLKNRKSFYSHIRIHKKKREYLIHKCTICHQKIKGKENFEKHMESHKGKESYVCHVCGKMYNFRSSFAVHVKNCQSDVKTKGKVCGICGKTISFGNLKRHLILHQGVRPFKCSMCDRAFALKSHIQKAHLSEKPFKCTFCGEAFLIYNHLKKHKRINHGEQLRSVSNITRKESQSALTKLQCDVCMKEFTANPNLIRHKQSVHSDVKLYQCQICALRCSRTDTLRVHMWRHCNKKKYACDLCDKGFNDKRPLINHQRKFHNLDI